MQAVAPLWQLYARFEMYQAHSLHRKLGKKEFLSLLNLLGYETRPNYWFHDEKFGDKQWTAVFGLELKEKFVLSDFESEVNKIEGTNDTGAGADAEKPDEPKLSLDAKMSFEAQVAWAGKEWQQQKQKPVDCEHLTSFLMWYCEHVDATKMPSDVCDMAEKVFGITPLPEKKKEPENVPEKAPEKEQEKKPAQRDLQSEQADDIPAELRERVIKYFEFFRQDLKTKKGLNSLTEAEIKKKRNSKAFREYLVHYCPEYMQKRGYLDSVIRRMESSGDLTFKW